MKLLSLLILAAPVFAGEYAVLKTGFRIYALRHEVAGAVTRIHTSSGTMEVPSTDVDGFEAEEYVAPPPAPPPVALAPVALAVAVPIVLSPAELLQKAAEKHGLRPEFVASVARAESAMRQDAISPKGAIGLMQLMPGTAQELGVNPHDPEQNAEAGARYLKQLLEKYSGSADPVRMALAAYNAGPGAVDRYGRIPPYAETQVYVERVLRKYLAELKSSSSMPARGRS
jgi:soluble lytic murein transglycosylase-like protein